MNKIPTTIGGAMDNSRSSRTFTSDELSVLVRALIAIRPHVDDDERTLINGIINDGWVVSPQPVVDSSAVSGEALTYTEAEVRTGQYPVGSPMWLATKVEPLIESNSPFGDVDQGPSAGLTVVVRVPEDEDPPELAEAVWQYFTANYEDPWQDYTWQPSLLSTYGPWSAGGRADLIVVTLYTFWGDGHRSVMP